MCRTSPRRCKDAGMTSVAVIGLGAMGARFAGRFLEAGHEVIVWNRTPEKAAELVSRGASAAASPAEAARNAEAVVTVVSDPEALRAVTEGPDGIAAGANASTTVIEMSTVGPRMVRWLETALPPGVGLLDAPVLGSLSEAEAGTLLVFVGGPRRLAERWIPLFGTLGSVIVAGPLGSGAAAKLVANATLVGTLTLLGETIALADRLGLGRRLTMDILAQTPLGLASKRRREQLETEEFPLRFRLALARKDAELIQEAAEAAHADTRVLAAAATWFADAEEAGLGDEDYSTVLQRIIDRG
ncbi:MAG TPA: NAD(P)-dependent oxidoreductase [Actinomycetota bacterium]|nr:NAD(P)-dependent oxidoreductase [Actinomycetota bacterium]